MPTRRSTRARTESSVPPQHHTRARAATCGPAPRRQHESDADGNDNNVGSADDGDDATASSDDDIFSYEPDDYGDDRFPSDADSDDDDDDLLR